MWVNKLRIGNLKSFTEEELNFSRGINLLVGRNNSGKTTIINALYSIQRQMFALNDKRIGTDAMNISIDFSETQAFFKRGLPEDATVLSMHFADSPTYGWMKGTKRVSGYEMLHSMEGSNFIYPYFSNRKVNGFNEQVTVAQVKSVDETLVNLYAKIDSLTQPEDPFHNDFNTACKNVLGFTISSVSSDAGKKACLLISRGVYIPLDKMGAGTPNLLGLIVQLCVADGHLFLIEEIENDLHPKALKGLLDLIKAKSKRNQFVISTHSNIVVKYLGSGEKNSIFHLTMNLENRVPTSHVTKVEDTSSAKLQVLEELGYDLFDFDLYKAYLILEESTAELVILKYLIPTFCPSLEFSLKTISAGGTGNIEPRISDFLRLFVFVHTAPVYNGRAWVFCDGDESGTKAITELREKFSSNWDNNHFQNFSEHAFEKYYPLRFQERADQILSIPRSEWQRKMNEKGQLAKDVVEWAKEHPEESLKEFSASAAEVIEKLRGIQNALNSM